MFVKWRAHNEDDFIHALNDRNRWHRIAMCLSSQLTHTKFSAVGKLSASIKFELSSKKRQKNTAQPPRPGRRQTVYFSSLTLFQNKITASLYATANWNNFELYSKLATQTKISPPCFCSSKKKTTTKCANVQEHVYDYKLNQTTWIRQFIRTIKLNRIKIVHLKILHRK